jgi:hypothetical protein
VISWFQAFAFKCNLYRYISARAAHAAHAVVRRKARSHAGGDRSEAAVSAGTAAGAAAVAAAAGTAAAGTAAATTGKRKAGMMKDDYVGCG